MSFASITACGVVSEPKELVVPTRTGERKVLKFNLYVIPKNKKNGFEDGENMCFVCSVWDNQVDAYRGLITKGREVTIHGNFEVARFTTKEGVIVEQNRIDFANIIQLGNSTEDRQILKEMRTKENAIKGKTSKV